MQFNILYDGKRMSPKTSEVTLLEKTKIMTCTLSPWSVIHIKHLTVNCKLAYFHAVLLKGSCHVKFIFIMFIFLVLSLGF